MPVYEYLCRENGQSVEVTHSMKEKLKTPIAGASPSWGTSQKLEAKEPSIVPASVFMETVSSPGGANGGTKSRQRYSCGTLDGLTK